MKFLLFLSIINGSNNPFNVGETLNFKASFSGVPAGKAKLKIIKEDTIQNKESLHIRFQAQTTGITNYIFPINDIIDLWIDKESLTPLLLKEKISQGTYKKEKELKFFQDNGFAIINNKDTITFKSEVHSPYSLFYFFRNRILKNLKKEKILIFQGQSLELLEINLKPNININSEIGNYLCTQIIPKKSNNKKFKNNSTMSIWFSNNYNKYPIKIWLKMKYGSLLLELIEVIN